MQRSKTRKVQRPCGRCYELSAKLVLDEGEGEVVHGQVWSAFFRRMINHAWVELPVGTTVHDTYGDRETLTIEAVVDLTIKKKLRLLPKHLYYAFTKAAPLARYAEPELRTAILREKTWGPWPVHQPNVPEPRPSSV
ncbi:MAG: hypothetical protein JSR31_10540 [Nitrospira sp.]|nr:hypothetical protein [Nitrospira sp.]